MIGPLRAAFHRRLRRRAGHLAGRIAPHLPAGATVLDIGSGTGHNAEALRTRGAHTCVEADVVDFHVVGGGPVLFDGARLPFADRVFDACLLVFVLSYSDDPAALLREAGRVASRRVLVLQSCPRGRAGRIALRLRSWVQGRVAFRLCATLRLIPPSPIPLRSRRLLSREQVSELADEAGMKLTQVVSEPGLLGLVSRDLFVLEGPAPGARPRGLHTPNGDAMPMKRPPPRISVVIPARNEAALIASTVGSVLRARDRYRETRRDGGAVEVIVVDNASDDGTADALARHTAEGGVLMATCTPRGAARARNLGARLASGRALVFLDADTRLPPGRSSGSRSWSTSKDTRRGSLASARSTAAGGPVAGGPSGTPSGGFPCPGPRRCRPACSAPERPSTSSGRSTSASPSARSGRSWPGSTAPGPADSSTIKPSRRSARGVGWSSSPSATRGPSPGTSGRS